MSSPCFIWIGFGPTDADFGQADQVLASPIRQWNRVKLLTVLQSNIRSPKTKDQVMETWDNTDSRIYLEKPYARHREWLSLFSRGTLQKRTHYLQSICQEALASSCCPKELSPTQSCTQQPHPQHPNDPRSNESLACEHFPVLNVATIFHCPPFRLATAYSFKFSPDVTPKTPHFANYLLPTGMR